MKAERIIVRREKSGDFIYFFPDDLDRGSLVCFTWGDSHNTACLDYYWRRTRPVSRAEAEEEARRYQRYHDRNAFDPVKYRLVTRR